MSAASLQGESTDCTVWRVGFRPYPWAWVDWSRAEDGRFQGRWDDPDGEFRTIYAGGTLQACLAEVLASLRPSVETAAEMEDIEEDLHDAEMYPTCAAGFIAYSWLEPRIASSATLTGQFCNITAMATIAGLRPRFMSMAKAKEYEDFDAATLKDKRARPITQAVSNYIWSTGYFHGIRFNSRLGDDISLWAIYERPDELTGVSPQISGIEMHHLSPEDPAIEEVFELFNLRWID